MSKPFIVLGDKTSHGGAVISACPTATTHGKPIARVGDKVSCPKCGTNTIASGDSTQLIMGKPVARHGDKTACGATLISSQSVTTDGGGGGGSSSSGSGSTENNSTKSNRTPATTDAGDSTSQRDVPATSTRDKSAGTSATESASTTGGATNTLSEPAKKTDSPLVCTASIQPNTFGDTLPIIPTASRVSGGKVLFKVTIKAQLKNKSDGKVAANQSLTVKSDNVKDKITSKGVTDSNGEMMLTLETRHQGTRHLTTDTQNVSMDPFDLNIDKAWYESKFLITGYNVCDENDFSGKLVKGDGLSEEHKEDFLYGARGIPMQGTGKASDGKFISLAGFNTHWHHNSRGNPDHVADESKVSFKYVSGPIGSSGRVVRKDHSIAVDNDVIPSGAQVDIQHIGTRYADDTGSQIVNYHIDNFLGAGDAVVKAWLRSGLSGSEQRVKFCGY